MTQQKNCLIAEAKISRVCVVVADWKSYLNMELHFWSAASKVGTFKCHNLNWLNSVWSVLSQRLFTNLKKKSFSKIDFDLTRQCTIDDTRWFTPNTFSFIFSIFFSVYVFAHSPFTLFLIFFISICVCIFVHSILTLIYVSCSFLFLVSFWLRSLLQVFQFSQEQCKIKWNFYYVAV